MHAPTNSNIDSSHLTEASSSQGQLENRVIVTQTTSYSASDSPFYLSVVVPARNEATRLPATIASLRKTLDLRNVRYEIIVVDDGSTDDTAAIATKLASKCVRHNRSRGIAASMRSGSSETTGLFVMTCPADVSDFDFLPSALEFAREFDIISVSKRHPQSVVKGYGARRWFMSNSYHLLVRVLFEIPRDLTDTHYVKFYRREKLLQAISHCLINGPVGETELMMHMLKMGASWKEIPATIIHNSNHSKTSISLVVRSAFEIGVLWYRKMTSRGSLRT